MSDKSTLCVIEWVHHIYPVSLPFIVNEMSADCIKKNSGYIVVIQGHLSESLAQWFEGLEVSALPDGHTLLIGKELDQAGLFGLLICIRDLGMTLVLIARRNYQFNELVNALNKGH